MKKRLTSIILTLCVMLTLLPTTVFAADTATPSDTKFVINGKSVSVTAAYVINNTNYLQLRAIAAMLDGTSAQFDVSWDGQYAVIEPGKPYSGTVTENKLKKTTDVRKSDTKFKMNGNVFTFSDARLIDGGTNYIQLREFAQKLSGTASQFNVYWDSAAGQAVIQPGAAYTGNPPQNGSTTSQAKGGIKRTINMDDLFILELSNTYAYTRTFGYDVEGAGYIHYIVVPEGSTIKCTKYVSEGDAPYTFYNVAPYDVIYFETGSMWPEKTYSSDDFENVRLSEGDTVTLLNGHEYFFQTASTDKAITSKYGKVSAVFYSLYVYVVPNDIASKVGGSTPKMASERQTLQEFYLPPGASTVPVTYVVNPDALMLPFDGWYRLFNNKGLDSYALVIASNGNAQLNSDLDTTVFYFQKTGKNQATLQMADGRYLGVDGTATDGAKVKLVKNPYLWNVYYENNSGYNGRYSLRPSTNTALALTASGTVKNGTPVVLSTQKSMDAPMNAEFQFYPAEVPESVAFTYAESGPEDGSIFYIKSSKDPHYTLQGIPPESIYLPDLLRKQIGANLHVYEINGDTHQRFRISRVKENQYTIQNVESGKWWTSDGTKGSFVTLTDAETIGNEHLFTFVRQQDGTYRIVDSNGLYVGISNADVDDFTNVVLWTEASDGSQTYLFEKIN